MGVKPQSQNLVPFVYRFTHSVQHYDLFPLT